MANKEYLAYVLEMLEPLHPTSRAMFGGYGVYRNGIIFAIIVDDQLYGKVGDSNKVEYVNAGSQPFQYESKGKNVSLSYWAVPPEIIDDQDILCAWMEKSYAVSINSKKTK